MGLNANIEEISKKTGLREQEILIIINFFNDMLAAMPDKGTYGDYIFNYKSVPTPFIHYCYSQYQQGVKADIIISKIKYIINCIEETEEQSKMLRIASDLFEVQFIGFLSTEQAKSINVTISALQSKFERQELLMKSFINSFQQLIFIIDLFGNISMCNNAAEKYFSLIRGMPYPKLLSLFNYDYIDTEEFLHTYMTRGRREIRLMNGSILHIEVRALKGYGGKTSEYFILFDEHPSEDNAQIICEPTSSLMKLTKTERQICSLIYDGMRNKEIASFLGISEDTVKNHRKVIRNKLTLNNKKVSLYYYLRENYKPDNIS